MKVLVYFKKNILFLIVLTLLASFFFFILINKPVFAQSCAGDITYYAAKCHNDTIWGCITDKPVQHNTSCSILIPDGNCGYCKALDQACVNNNCQLIGTTDATCRGTAAKDTAGCFWVGSPPPGQNTPTPGGPSLPPPPPPTVYHVKKPFVVFNDMSYDGIWNTSTEPRISGDAACTNSGTPPALSYSYLPGLSFSIPPDEEWQGLSGWKCNIQNGEFVDGGGTPYNGSCGADPTVKQETIMNSCFLPASLMNAACQDQDGHLIGNQPTYTNNGTTANQNLKNGPIWMASTYGEDTPAGRYHKITITIPTTWSITQVRYVNPINIASPIINLYSVNCSGATCDYVYKVAFKSGDANNQTCNDNFVTVGIIPKTTCDLTTSNLTPMPTTTGTPYRQFKIVQNDIGKTVQAQTNLNSDISLYKSPVSPKNWAVTPGEFNPQTNSGTSLKSVISPTIIPPNQYFVACQALTYENAIRNAGFETGNTSNWSANSDIATWGTLNCNTNAPCQEGTYYLRISRVSGAANPNVASDWYDTGSNNANKTFKLSFWARSTTGSPTISGIIVQRGLTGGLTGGTTNYQIGNISLTTTWQFFEKTVTFDSTNSSPLLRVALKPPSGTDTSFVYYDNIQLREDRVYNQICSGKVPVPAGFDSCGTNSNFILNVVTPTPPPGQINVSFQNGNNVLTCNDIGNLPATSATISTSTSDCAADPSPRVCSPSASAPLNTTTSLSNLYIDPALDAGVGTFYTTISSLPSGWYPCNSSSSSQPSYLKSGSPTQSILYKISQTIGPWFQVLGGDTHLGSLSGASSVTGKYFNIASPTSDIGLISTSNSTFSCTNLEGGGTMDCHSDPNRDWILGGRTISGTSTSNPTKYQDFFDYLPNKQSGNGNLNNGFFTSKGPGTYDFGSTNIDYNNPSSINTGKYIFLTTGDVTISKDVVLASSTDFFAIITRGKITVATDVIRMDGIFISGNGINDATDDAFEVEDGVNPLLVNGEVIADSIRNLKTSVTGGEPSVKFIFNPTLISNMPASLKNNASFTWSLIQR